METEKWRQPSRDLALLVSAIGECEASVRASYGCSFVPDGVICDEQATLNSGREAIDYIMAVITNKTPAPKEVGFNQIPFDVEQKEEDDKKQYHLRAAGNPYGPMCGDQFIFEISIKER